MLFFDNFLQQIASVLVYKNMMSTDVPVVTVTATTSQGVPPLPDDPAVLKRMIVELLAALKESPRFTYCMCQEITISLPCV